MTNERFAELVWGLAAYMETHKPHGATYHAEMGTHLAASCEQCASMYVGPHVPTDDDIRGFIVAANAMPNANEVLHYYGFPSDRPGSIAVGRTAKSGYIGKEHRAYIEQLKVLTWTAMGRPSDISTLQVVRTK